MKYLPFTAALVVNLILITSTQPFWVSAIVVFNGIWLGFELTKLVHEHLFHKLSIPFEAAVDKLEAAAGVETSLQKPKSAISTHVALVARLCMSVRQLT